MDHSFNTSTPNDDDFYAELTRQILLLTDEDDDVQAKKKGGRRLHRRPVGGWWSVMPGNYFFSWSESGEVEVPGWMERLWAANGGGGTGVFIPRGGVHRSRKRHNKPRKNLESSIAS
ncbi:unnamed protein product [Lactuca saligna]|uniref:Uncharacterized protein n=1 Tax=Lactuca saligna TaxID=75948 RepID=A0AA35YL82_LACSI|nr:unnamed protein product [Lactuca saligna]